MWVEMENGEFGEWMNLEKIVAMRNLSMCLCSVSWRQVL